MVESALQEAFLIHIRNEWFDFMKTKEVPVDPAYYLNETFKDSQVLSRKMVVEFDHLRLGKIKQLNISIYSQTPLERYEHRGLCLRHIPTHLEKISTDAGIYAACLISRR